MKPINVASGLLVALLVLPVALSLMFVEGNPPAKDSGPWPTRMELALLRTRFVEGQLDPATIDSMYGDLGDEERLTRIKNYVLGAEHLRSRWSLATIDQRNGQRWYVDVASIRDSAGGRVAAVYDEADETEMEYAVWCGERTLASIRESGAVVPDQRRLPISMIPAHYGSLLVYICRQ